MLKWLNLAASIEAFSHTMTGQTFLDIEGNHLAIMNHNFRHWHDCAFPQPIAASESILIETYEHGRLVSDFTEPTHQQRTLLGSKGASVERSSREVLEVALATGSRQQRHPNTVEELTRNHSERTALTHIPRQLITLSAVTAGLGPQLPPSLAHFVVTRGEDLYLKMLLVDGLMHADLHPGNILLDFDLSDGTQALSNARIVLVDAGMVANLRPAEQLNFVGLLEAIGEGDGAEAAAHVLK